MHASSDRVTEAEFFGSDEGDGFAHASPQERIRGTSTADARSLPAVTAPRFKGFAPAILIPYIWRHSGLIEATKRALMREGAIGAAFNFIPVMLALGAFTYFLSSAEPPFLLLIALAGLSLAAVVALKGRPAYHLLATALLCISIGALAAKIETVRAGTKMLGGEITTRLTGRIVATDHLASGRVRLTIDVMSTQRPTLRYAPDRIRVSSRSIAGNAKAGDIVTGVVRLLPPLGPVRPGGYDFAFESYFDGIGATGFFLTQPIVSASTEQASWPARFAAGVENVRDRLAARIRTRIGGAEGEIAAALITGVRAGIPEEVNEALRRTGLAHILSISGLHMVLVAGVIMGGLRLGFACFPNFTARHPVRKYAAAVALVALAVYLFISGYQVAAQRSFIMIAIMLAALLFDHAAFTLRNLALAAITVILLSPHEVVGPSFQMSFAATAALIGAYAGWSARERSTAAPHRDASLLGRGARVMVIYVGGLILTSLLAGTATAIYGAYHFQRVSPLSLFANLAAMPFVSILVMPFAVIGLIAMPFGLDGYAFAVMGKGLRIMILIAEWFSDRSPLDAVGLVAPSAVIVLTIALLLATLLTTWLRIMALPFLAIGLILSTQQPRPMVLISDDARLVAVAVGSDTIAVNRSRPNDFTIENWKRTLASEEVVKPMIVDALPEPGNDTQPDGKSGGFTCDKSNCVAMAGGVRILTTSDAPMAKRSCAWADLIILDDPTATKTCGRREALVVTRRDLAQRGSTMIFAGTASSAGAGTSLSIATNAQARTSGNEARARAILLTPVFSMSKPYRPWHDQRRYSREARGMPTWKPDPTKARKPTDHDAGAAPVAPAPP